MDLLNVVSEEESQQIENLLNKAFENAPSFHTDTEIRVGVLDGSKFPTPASKYYRSLSEINKIQVGLKTLIFDVTEDIYNGKKPGTFNAANYFEGKKPGGSDTQDDNYTKKLTD